MNVEVLAKHIAVAKGEVKANLVLKNGNIVDIFCHRTYIADVAIEDGIIVGLGQYDGLKNVDCTNKYIMPSFFDTHLHFESSMVTPDKYLAVAIPHGVTMLNCDSHEIANVCGEDGIQFMIDSTVGVPIDVNFMLPSCVPVTPFEHGNADITAADTKRLMDSGKFFGIAEMMNYPGVLAKDGEVLAKIATSDIVDGHAPHLSGNMLNAYLSTGILTDHECESAAEVYEKISRGMYVMVREGSQTKNLTTLIEAVNAYTKRRLMFCTDDRYIGEVRETGSLQNCIVTAVENGVDVYDAIAMASLNAYECYGIRNNGAVAINFKADLVVADALVPRNITQVYKGGVLVAENGKPLFKLPKADCSKVVNTVNIKPIAHSDFALAFKPNKSTVIEVMKDTVATKKVYCDSSNVGLNKMAVIERHNATGNIGKCWVKGFNLEGGAIAQTIGHDSHNITVVGDNDSDMLAAVNALGRDGGIVVVMNGVVKHKFTLDIAGLMSSKEVNEVIAEHEKLDGLVKELGINDDIAPFMLLSFLSLIVIPEVKLSDSGLFDVNEFRFIEE
jgi:adenine deaminase